MQESRRKDEEKEREDRATLCREEEPTGNRLVELLQQFGLGMKAVIGF